VIMGASIPQSRALAFLLAWRDECGPPGSLCIIVHVEFLQVNRDRGLKRRLTFENEVEAGWYANNNASVVGCVSMAAIPASSAG
jgi:hypothetical protein